MRNIVLHVGLPKTGTTSLQKNMFNYIRNEDLCYNPPTILDLLTEAVKLIDISDLREKDVLLLQQALHVEYKKIKCKTIFISHEILMQRLGSFDYKKRIDFLKKIFPQAYVFLVLRYQPHLLRSLYQQLLHQNYLLFPEEVFVPFTSKITKVDKSYKRNLFIDIKEWNYVDLVCSFRNSFGNNIQVLFYENYSKNIYKLGEDILKPFIDDFSFTQRSKKLRQNISYDARTINLLFMMAKYKIAFKDNQGIESRHVKNMNQEYKSARQIFDSSSAEELLNKLTSSNRKHPNTYNIVDEFLYKLIRKQKTFFAIAQQSKSNLQIQRSKYSLPNNIMEFLIRDAHEMNQNLCKYFDQSKIPEIYLSK